MSETNKRILGLKDLLTLKDLEDEIGDVLALSKQWGDMTLDAELITMRSLLAFGFQPAEYGVTMGGGKIWSFNRQGLQRLHNDINSARKITVERSDTMGEDNRCDYTGRVKSDLRDRDSAVAEVEKTRKEIVRSIISNTSDLATIHTDDDGILDRSAFVESIAAALLPNGLEVSDAVPE